MAKHVTEYLVGADPEVFVYDTASKKFISAHDLIPGTKEEPEPVAHGAIQVDGVAAEFNIAPSATAQEFSFNIRSVLSQLLERIKNKNKYYVIKALPTVTFSKKYFKTLPYEVKLLGCEPDINAYTGKKQAPTNVKTTLRSGAGHIHIGWTQYQDINDVGHAYDCNRTTRNCDAILYPSSLLWDSNNDRRLLYGQIGSHRIKPYGVEYRSLSNAWICNPDLHHWIFNAAVGIMKADDNGIDIERNRHAEDMVATIRENKTYKRKTLVDYHRYMCSRIDIPVLPEEYLV